MTEEELITQWGRNRSIFGWGEAAAQIVTWIDDEKQLLHLLTDELDTNRDLGAFLMGLRNERRKQTTTESTD